MRIRGGSWSRLNLRLRLRWGHLLDYHLFLLLLLLPLLLQPRHWSLRLVTETRVFPKVYSLPSPTPPPTLRTCFITSPLPPRPFSRQLRYPHTRLLRSINPAHHSTNHVPHSINCVSTSPLPLHRPFHPLLELFFTPPIHFWTPDVMRLLATRCKSNLTLHGPLSTSQTSATSLTFP